jgi:sec-independent protein translocase protein TatA
MFKQIGAGEIILILAVLLLLFGSKKLPELARSLGKSARELKKGLREGDDSPDDEA